MKTRILIAVVSVVLFATSMVGLLALQGRLNYHGTRGVPIVSLLFSAPPEPEGPQHEGEAGTVHGPGAQAAPARTGDAGTAPGSSAAHDEPKAGAPSSKDGQAAGDKGPADPGQPPGQGQARAAGDEDAHGRPEDSQGQSPRLPATFQYPPVPSRLSAEEIMAASVQIEERRRKLELDRAQLEFEKEALAVRERDVEERRKAVRNDMALVQSKSDELEKRLKDFESSAALLKRQEQKNFKEQAEKLSLMDPKKASEYLLEFGPEGEERAVKLLACMDAESAARILESMDHKRGARLLERGLKLVREGSGS